MTELLIAVLVVVLVSAICSLCEAALYSIPVGYIETLSRKKKRSGIILKQLRKDINQPITAILSLNTIANTAGATVAGALATKALGVENLLYFSAGLTIVILIFSEVVPKTVGVIYCRPLATIIAVPIQILVKLFRPIIWVCGIVTGLISGKHVDEQLSLEEFLVMARMTTKSGAIRKDEAVVIQNIIGLRTKSVDQIMTPRNVCFMLPISAVVKNCFRNKKLISHSRIPVYGEGIDDIKGVVYRRDILRYMAEGNGAATLAELVKKTTFIPETTRLDKVLRNFLHSRHHLNIAIDEYGGFAGLVTLEDVIEEVLGTEIVDSTDVVSDMRSLAKNSQQRLLSKNTPSPDDELE